MTNEELRIAIAELKGYLEIHKNKYFDLTGFLPIENAKEGDDVEKYTIHAIPNYPEDIAAAMELFDEMQADDDCIVVALEADHSGRVTCAFEGFVFSLERTDNMKARAISLTYHAWKGAK